MSVYELIKNRRSVRNMKDEKISADIIEKLLDAANNAPSGGNIQPISIILVQGDEGRKVLSEINGNQPWVKNAPLSMIFCIDFYRVKKWASMFNAEFKGESALSHFLIAYADVMCAAQNVVILGEQYGLGSVYIGTIQSSIDRAREYFEIPKYVLPMMVLSIGYPKSVPSSMPKIKREVITHSEKYREISDIDVKKAFEDKYGSVDENLEKYFEKAFIEVVEADKQSNEGWIKRASEQMKRLDIKSNAEFLFKVRYPSDKMVQMNENINNALKNAGFDFFER